MKQLKSFELVYENGLAYTRIMDTDSDVANDIATNISEDWEKNNATFMIGRKVDTNSDVLVFYPIENLDSDFWEGELRIYHVRGDGALEGFLRAKVDAGIQVLGVSFCNEKNLKITISPVYNLNLNQLFPKDFNLTEHLSNLNFFGHEIRLHNFDIQNGGVLEKASYIAEGSLRYLVDDEKDTEYHRQELINLIKKNNPNSPSSLYLIISKLIKYNFNDSITAEQLAELLVLREDVIYMGAESGVEPGFYDVMYDDISKKEYNKVMSSIEKENLEFNSSEYRIFIKSIRNNLSKLKNITLEIDLFLLSKLK